MIDRLLEKLSDGQEVKEKFKEKLSSTLSEIARKEYILSLEMLAEAEHLAYDHLKQEALKMVESQRKRAETIRELMTGLSGNNPEEIIPEGHQPTPDGEFSEIIRLEHELIGQLVEASNLAEDYGLRHEARVLRDLKDEHHQELINIEDIIIRINTLI